MQHDLQQKTRLQVAAPNKHNKSLYSQIHNRQSIFVTTVFIANLQTSAMSKSVLCLTRRVTITYPYCNKLNREATACR